MWHGVLRTPRSKLFLMMKLTFFFLMLGLLEVHASVKAQVKTVNLDVRNMPLKEVFGELKKQTELDFFFSNEELDMNSRVTIQVEKADLMDVLARILGRSYQVEIIKGMVIIKPAIEIDSVRVKSITLRGFVRDVKKQPLPGVTIQLSGTSVGVATDVNGWFAVKLPVLKGKLEFSYVGYQKIVMEFTEKMGKDTLQVVLKEDVAALDEVVVRAYSTQNKKEVVSSIATITAEEMKELPAASFISMLQGRLPGLNIVNQSGAPGSAADVAIRGYNSLVSVLGNSANGASDNQPLYVVDGMPMQSFVSPQTGTNTLADLDPSMIESVSVLKDAAAAAIYGSRAANGVILITTKKGKAGYNKFIVNGSYSVSKMLEYPEQTGGRMERRIKSLWIENQRGSTYNSSMGSYVYPTSYEEAWENGGTSSYDGWWGNGTVSAASKKKKPLYQDSLNPFYNNQTNWYKYATRTANVKNVNLQVSGGSDKFQYMLGAGYYDETGIMLNSRYARANVLFNLSAQPVPHLRIDGRVYGAYMDRSFNSGSMISNRYEGMTVNPREMSTLLLGGGVVEEDWLKVQNGERSRADDYRAQGSLLMEYEILKGLSISVSGMLDFTQGNLNQFRPSTLDPQFNENYSKGGMLRKISLLTEELLRYNTSIREKHNIELLLGLSVSKDQEFSMQGSGRRSGSDYVYYYPVQVEGGIHNYGTATSPRYRPLTTYESNFKEKTMVSYFGRIGYNYKRRYLVEFTYRQDGSSTFGENHRWAKFPSIALGWAFSEESFIKKWTERWLSWGKVRASYGTSGQIFADAYLAHGIVKMEGGSFNGVTLAEPGENIAPELTWEKTKQYDIGLDMDMFDNRVGLKFDYYYKYTDGLLYSVSLPGDIYYNSTQMQNALEVSNEGIEFDVQADIFRESAVKWRTKFNVSRNWNRFEKSANGRDIGNLIQGRPVNAFNVYVDDGYFQNEDEVPRYYNMQGDEKYLSNDRLITISAKTGYSNLVGTPKIMDLNGDGVINNKDRMFYGTSLPMAHGGWANEISWKNFDLNVLFNITLSRQMRNNNAWTLTQGNPVFVDLRGVSFWSKEGDNTTYGRIGTYAESLRSQIEKVNSVSLKQITLGYNLPKQFVKKIRLSEARVFVTGENIFYWSNYSGGNPEVISVYTGVDDGGQYPLPQTWTIG